MGSAFFELGKQSFSNFRNGKSFKCINTRKIAKEALISTIAPYGKSGKIIKDKILDQRRLLKITKRAGISPAGSHLNGVGIDVLNFGANIGFKNFASDFTDDQDGAPNFFNFLNFIPNEPDTCDCSGG